jgi:GNAT superfamily N-acetyltransferase
LIINPSQLIVRPMQFGDAAAIIEMAHALAAAVGDPAPRLTKDDLIRDGLGSGRWFDCFVAEADGTLTGYTLACKAYEAHTAHRRLWLGDLFVRPEARRNGTGRALLAAVARRAVELGCDAVYWELWRLNEEGGAFYRRFGVEEAADLAVMRLGGPSLARVAASR